MKILNTIVAIIISIVITGCDPSISYEYIIENQTDSSLAVTYRDWGLSQLGRDSVISVLPKSDALFFEVNITATNPHDEGDEFLQFFDTISVSTSDGTPLLVDINRRENWEYNNEVSLFGLMRVGTNFYTLKVDSTDID